MQTVSQCLTPCMKLWNRHRLTLLLSFIFVPARFAADAIMEAADAGIQLIVCIAEGIPTLDVIKAHQFIKQKGAILVGPNCPGLISPGKSMVGILPGQVFQKGNVGVISRSGTLTYEIVYHLTANGMGQSTAIGIGGDPVVGLHFRELLEMFQNDTETEAIVLIGEIGGNAEEQAAEYIRNHVTKPVVAFIAGQSAPNLLLWENKWGMQELLSPELPVRLKKR